MSFLENPLGSKELDEDDKNGSYVKSSKFIVDDDKEIYEENESDEETELFDSVCCICDDGGELLGCKGRCMRSFHATPDAGIDSHCKSLGLSDAQVNAIQNFFCLNCQHKRYQCFACGKLGSSDKSSGAEVFSCVSATCGFFYHPDCIAKLLNPIDEAEAEAEALRETIAAGESFTCPAHKCHFCKEGENKDVHDLQFAVCRRCPRAYHRKCMPRKIAFKGSEEKHVITRAWEILLPNNRVLIYCLKHKMDDILGTPLRNHVVFPHDRKCSIQSIEPQSNQRKAAKSKFVVKEDSSNEKVVSKISKHSKKSTCDIKASSSLKETKHFSLALYEKSKTSDASRKHLKDGTKSASMKKGSMPSKSNQQNISSSEVEGSSKSALLSSLSLGYDDTKNRIMALMKEKSSLITLEDIIKQHKGPSTHAYSMKTVVNKTITLAKVERFVEAVRTALQKLESRGSIEDARAVCGPEVVNQIVKWKIVDKLNWYVNDGDMVVDFCCGSNDFSWLMKEKLLETGKNCFFKNFNIM